MGFFNRVNRIWSGLDFWDKDENRAQREGFAYWDEEDERRRAMERVARGAVTTSEMAEEGAPEVRYDPAEPLRKVGSQSGYKEKDSFGDRLKKTGTALGLSALRVGTGIAQGAGGLYDLATPGKGQNRLTKWSTKVAEDIDATAKAEDVEKAYKFANVPFEIGSYFTPGVVTKIPKIATQGNKLIKVGDKVVDAAQDSGRLKRFGAEGVQELLKPQNIRQEARLTGRYLGQDSAKGEDIGPEDIALNATAALGGSFAIPMIGKGVSRLFKSGLQDAGNAGNVVKEDAVRIPGTALEKTPVSGEPPKIEVDDGIKSSNLAKEAENQPAFQRGYGGSEEVPVPKTNEQLAVEANLRKQGYTDDEMIPAFQRREANVPDVANPIALAKIPDELPPTPVASPIMADFRNSIDAPLEKAVPEATQAVPVAEPTPTDIAQAAAVGEARIPTRTDAEGNVAMTSDAEYQRALADEGVVPPRGESPVLAAEERLAGEAEQVARGQVNVGDTPAPRTRERLIEDVEGESLRQELIDIAPPKERVVLADAENRAKVVMNDSSDDDLIRVYQNPQKMETPDDLFQALVATRRLQSIETPEARQAVRNITDAISEQSSRSGLWQRASQVLFEDMPTPMKTDYLLKKLNRLGMDIQEADQRVLVSLIEGSDDALTKVRQLEDQANEIMESGVLNNSSIPEDILRQIDELPDAIATANREKELRSGAAWKFYQDLVDASPEGKSPMGKRVGDVGRTLMLSSPSGRIFDVLSTGATTADDLATRSVSNLIGKGVNLQKAGRVTSTLPSPSRLIKGVGTGLKDTYAEFKGKDRVEDFLKEATRFTRGDINTGGGPFRRAVRSLVQLPTNITRGIEGEVLYRKGIQEAAQQGLNGKARRAYAELRAATPTKNQLHEAVETHMRANMLHDNGVSRALNSFARKLDEDKVLGGWLAPLIRNQVAPFTSWLGGNIHRTLTDKNVLWNVGSAIKNATKGNSQGVIDDVSKLAVNTTEAYAAGMLLTQAGIITTEDANGDNYAGLYFHIGDRYIPVAIAGTVSVPIILGNSLQQSLSGDSDKGMLDNLVSNTLKNAGVASVFGGENNLQSTILNLADENSPVLEDMAEYGGNLVRQYIPSFMGDINAVLDQTKLNPTGEAAETKVTYKNPETGREKTNVFATELAKTAGRIPFLAQSLPRREDTRAKDLVDRSTRGNRESDEMAQKRGEEEQKEATAETLEERKKGLEDMGYSVNPEGVNDAFDEGRYDWLVEYNKYKMEEEKNDGKLTENERRKYEKETKKFEIYQDGEYGLELVTAYEKHDSSDGGIGVTAWRKMLESEDKELIAQAEELEALDKKLLKAGIIDKEKYYYLDKDGRRTRRGSGKGGRGRSKKGPRFITSIGTQSFAQGGGFQPLQARAATFGSPQSSIPVIEKVPNYDRSKLKKISVSKGGRP